VAASVLLLPAGASAGEGDNSCRKAADRYTAVKKTKSGAIFYKRVGSRRFQLFYGCLYSTERLRLLPGQDRSPGPKRAVRAIALNGRFAAYGVDRQGPPGRVLLYDLKRGRTVFAGRGNSPETAEERGHNDIIVHDIVGNANGSIAWISFDADVEQPIGQVHVRDIDGPRRAIDRSTQIGQRSLTKARDGRTISWVRDGQRQTAPLP
jgi:hypothetical protein